MSGPVEILTDEAAAAIWSGDTVGLMSTQKPKEDTQPVTPITSTAPPKPSAPLAKEETIAPVPEIDEDDVSAAFAIDDEEEEDDTDTQANGAQGAAPATQAKPGRKATDLVAMVNKLITDNVLMPFEDGEVKTQEEAIELIKGNLAEKEAQAKEEGWKEIVKSKYSPQIQTILHYADQGAQSADELLRLMNAIKDIEDVNELDPNTTDGRKEIIRQAYKSRGFKADYVEEHINTLADLGEEKLKSTADKLLPELTEIKKKQVEAQLREAEDRRKSAEEASKTYYKNIENVLKSDTVGKLKLAKEDKARLIEAVVGADKYRNLNGRPTTEFVKVLEDLQFGKTPDYGHFLNIVHLAVDPKGFYEKIGATIKTETTEAQVRKIKQSKTTTPNTEDTVRTTSGARKTITRGGFNNPFK